ncbi:MAG: TIGR04076 family protein [Candidatus Omnitrophica bacterium]|nr:TIGR04076 family protein [Candidatus Omnitrophota bacterium]
MCRYSGLTCQIEVISKEGACRYHAKGCRYDGAAITPAGLCPEIYHNAYPYCLSLIYGASFDEEILVRCPSTEAQVVVQIRSKPMPLFLMPGQVLRTVLNLFTPIEIARKQAIILIKSVQGPCRKEHKACQEYLFPLGSKFFAYHWSAGAYFFEKLGLKLKSSKELCPAFFDSFYPISSYFSKNNCFPWKNECNEKIVQCPDYHSGIKIGCKT